MKTIVCLFGLGLYAQNVGIGTPNPSERLHVAGNLRLDGAFMPGNDPGSPGSVLLSAGPGTPPVWHNPFGTPCTPTTGAIAGRLVRWTSSNQYCNSILAENASAQVWNQDVRANPFAGDKFSIYGDGTNPTAIAGYALSGFGAEGVYGQATGSANATGVYGATDVGTGVIGFASGNAGWGVWGIAQGNGGRAVIGMAQGGDGIGVYGIATNATNPTGVAGYVGTAPGYYPNTAGSFVNDLAGGTGVFGVATNATDPTGVAGYVGNTPTRYLNAAGSFINDLAGGTGVFGAVRNATNPTGVAGYVGNAPVAYINAAGSFRNDLAGGIGVFGVATNATNPTGVAGYVGNAPTRYLNTAGSFRNENGGHGVVGATSTAGQVGVLGVSSNGNNTNWGVFSNGNFGASGAKSFVIDHPFDPENKYLYHYAIESMRPYNMYMGTVTTDAQGLATVELPPYFEAINKDPHYVLTPIGTFAQAIVKEKIQNNRFVIQTDKPNVEVTWMVYATRNDVYIRHYAPWAVGPSPDEVEKPAPLKGKYFVPELFGKDESYGFLQLQTIKENEATASPTEIEKLEHPLKQPKLRLLENEKQN